MELQSSTEARPRDWDANSHYQDAEVARRYDAARFSSLAGRVFNNWERRVVVRAFCGLSPGSHIADIPCGTGRLAEALLVAGYRVHGMDISSQMLDVAHERLSRFGTAFTSEVADAKHLDTLDRRFDGVLCARVLMHFELDEQMSFLKGVATLGARKIVINHSFDSPYQRLRRSIKRWLGHQMPARRPVANDEIQVLLAAAGLRETRRLRLNPLVSEAVYIVAEPVGSGTT